MPEAVHSAERVSMSGPPCVTLERTDSQVLSHQGWWSWCFGTTTYRLKHPHSCRGLNLTEPQCPHQHNRDNSSNYITGLI